MAGEGVGEGGGRAEGRESEKKTEETRKDGGAMAGHGARRESTRGHARATLAQAKHKRSAGPRAGRQQQQRGPAGFVGFGRGFSLPRVETSEP